jgi:hypothetical protein
MKPGDFSKYASDKLAIFGAVSQGAKQLGKQFFRGVARGAGVKGGGSAAGKKFLGEAARKGVRRAGDAVGWMANNPGKTVAGLTVGNMALNRLSQPSRQEQYRARMM